MQQDGTREVWFEGAGTRLFAVESGEGEALIFLHGGLSDHRGAQLRAGSLSRHFRLVTPDVRGAGRSHFAEELTWDLLADDVLALLRALGVERAIIGGSSAGSAIALRFALRHPAHTRALLLVSPVYAGENGLNEAQRCAMQRMHEVGLRTLSEGVDALLPLFGALPAPIRDAALTMARSFDPASVAATTRFLASMEPPFRTFDELAVIGCPALLVPGEDAEHPAELAERYARHLPHGRLVSPRVDVAAALRDALRT